MKAPNRELQKTPNSTLKRSMRTAEKQKRLPDHHVFRSEIQQDGLQLFGILAVGAVHSELTSGNINNTARIIETNTTNSSQNKKSYSYFSSVF